MTHNDTYSEIEVKLYLTDLNNARAQLAQIGAVLAKPRVYEYNVRYDTRDGQLVNDGLVLRLRKDTQYRLTYKEPMEPLAAARGVHQRYEVEVTLNDFDAMDTILNRLGYVARMIYEKYRTTYRLDDVEIVLDEMPYGAFVEVEAPNEATIHDILEQLGLAQLPRLSYSYSQLFQHVRANLGLDFQDLTFANFDGISVPPTAFEKPE